jgi:transcriptional regulator with XRE-family HTH domain
MTHRSQRPRRYFSPGALLLASVGVTQADIAARLGVTQQTVSGWLRPTCTPPRALLDVVEDIAGVAIADQLARTLGVNRAEVVS